MSGQKIDRLDFLRKGSSLAMGAVVTAIAGGIPGMLVAAMADQKPVPPKGKTIGLQLYSLRDQMYDNPDETLMEVMMMGYRTLELVDYAGGRVFGFMVEEFRTKCNALGLAIISSHVKAPRFAEENEEEMKTQWENVLEDHRIMGCRHIVIPKLNIGHTMAEIEADCLYLNIIGEMANNKGLRLAYHNSSEATRAIDGKPALELLIEGTAPEKVDFQLDTFWLRQGGESPEIWLKRYPERFTSLHIRDKSTIGDNPKTDFKPVFDQFFANGKRDYFVEIEWYERFSPQVCAQRSFNYLDIVPFIV